MIFPKISTGQKNSTNWLARLARFCNSETVYHGFGEYLKLSGRLKQSSLKLSAGFFKYSLLDFRNLFFVLQIAWFDRKWKRVKVDFAHIYPMGKFCIRDNPFVQLPSAIWISVSQMRKWIKLSLSWINSCMVGFYQTNGLLFTPSWLPYSTYLYLDFHLCSMTKLKEHSREIC